MNRNNGTRITKTQRGGAPHPVMGAAIVKTLRATSLQVPVTAPRRGAMFVENNAPPPLQQHPVGVQPRYPLPVIVFTLSEAQTEANRSKLSNHQRRWKEIDRNYPIINADGRKSIEFIQSSTQMEGNRSRLSNHQRRWKEIDRIYPIINADGSKSVEIIQSSMQTEANRSKLSNRTLRQKKSGCFYTFARCEKRNRTALIQNRTSKELILLKAYY